MASMVSFMPGQMLPAAAQQHVDASLKLLSACLSVCLSVYLSIYLSVCFFVDKTYNFNSQHTVVRGSMHPA
jgi:hypothetical protein